MKHISDRVGSDSPGRLVIPFHGAIRWHKPFPCLSSLGGNVSASISMGRCDNQAVLLGSLKGHTWIIGPGCQFDMARVANRSGLINPRKKHCPEDHDMSCVRCDDDVMGQTIRGKLGGPQVISKRLVTIGACHRHGQRQISSIVSSRANISGVGLHRKLDH